MREGDPEHEGDQGTHGAAVVALLVAGLFLLVRAPSAADDAAQCVGLLAGGLGVGTAVLLMRGSVLKP